MRAVTPSARATAGEGRSPQAPPAVAPVQMRPVSRGLRTGREGDDGNARARQPASPSPIARESGDASRSVPGVSVAGGIVGVSSLTNSPGAQSAALRVLFASELPLDVAARLKAFRATTHKTSLTPWTLGEDRLVCKGLLAGATYGVIGQATGRTESASQNRGLRLIRAGVVEKRDQGITMAAATRAAKEARAAERARRVTIPCMCCRKPFASWDRVLNRLCQHCKSEGE